MLISLEKQRGRVAAEVQKHSWCLASASFLTNIRSRQTLFLQTSQKTTPLSWFRSTFLRVKLNDEKKPAKEQSAVRARDERGETSKFQGLVQRNTVPIMRIGRMLNSKWPLIDCHEASLLFNFLIYSFAFLFCEAFSEQKSCAAYNNRKIWKTCRLCWKANQRKPKGKFVVVERVWNVPAARQLLLFEWMILSVRRASLPISRTNFVPRSVKHVR